MEKLRNGIEVEVDCNRFGVFVSKGDMMYLLTESKLLQLIEDSYKEQHEEDKVFFSTKCDECGKPISEDDWYIEKDVLIPYIWCEHCSKGKNFRR